MEDQVAGARRSRVCLSVDNGDRLRGDAEMGLWVHAMGVRTRPAHGTGVGGRNANVLSADPLPNGAAFLVSADVRDKRIPVDVITGVLALVVVDLVVENEASVDPLAAAVGVHLLLVAERHRGGWGHPLRVRTRRQKASIRLLPGRSPIEVEAP